MKKLVITDFDGVLTSTKESPGSYMNLDAEYGVSPSCFKRLCQLCIEEEAAVVISSNWRRFDDEGRWSYCTFDGVHAFGNPLPKLKKMLGRLYVGDLPKDRHTTKAEALILWLEQTGYSGKYVVFDDDLREGYQSTSDYGIKDHFIKTDPVFGLTDEDVKKAKEILA